MSKALILGGTKGLGYALADECIKSGIAPIIAGRSVTPAVSQRISEKGGVAIRLDLVDESTFAELEALLSREKVDYFFWVAGIFGRGPFGEIAKERMNIMIATHLSGPLRVIQSFHSSQKHPYHLVVIASTSSWRLRDNETLYCALKAAKAAFTRNFAKELSRERPGSRVMLVNPGGMKTPDFWEGSGQDISEFMDPAIVAHLIWDEVQSQQSNFREIQIIRGVGGCPILEEGPRTPELPT